MELNQYPKKKRPVRVLQFGEGAFLRGFCDYMIDVANESGVYDGSIVVVKPTLRGSLQKLRDQGCNYTVLLRGLRGGETVSEQRVVTSIADAIESHLSYEAFLALARLPSLETVLLNTTEAGLVYDEADPFDARPPASCPARLTKFLYERFRAGGSGLILLPLELVENNGGLLKSFVLRHSARWGLPEAFSAWLKAECVFCNTLVDRILTGFPKEEAPALFERLGYTDAYLDAGECFGLWVIESDRLDRVRAALPLDKAGQPVLFTDDLTPYRERKVRLLNGAHTGTVLAGYLAGFDTVGECMRDPVVRGYMEKLVYGEIAPNVPLPRQDVLQFARDMFDRFENPFNKHYLLTISLNSVSKWRARLLPTIRDHLARTGTLARCAAFSLAALLAFYCGDAFSGDVLTGHAGGREYPITDDRAVLSFFLEHGGLPAAELARAALRNASLWGEDLTKIPGLEAAVAENLAAIRNSGARAAMEELIK